MRPATVLVVEDSALMRRLVVDLIEESGEFRVVAEARTGYEAIRLVHERDPDLITLDLELPDLGGLDTLGYIMSEAPRPVVILSAHSGAEPTLRALDYGAVDFVVKPGGDERRQAEALRVRLLEALRAAAIAELANLPVVLPERTDRLVRRRGRTAPHRTPWRWRRRPVDPGHSRRWCRGCRSGCPRRSSSSSTCRRASRARSPSG